MHFLWLLFEQNQVAWAVVGIAQKQILDCGAAAEESVFSLRVCVDFGLRSFLGLHLKIFKVSRNFL